MFMGDKGEEIVIVINYQVIGKEVNVLRSASKMSGIKTNHHSSKIKKLQTLEEE